MFENVVPFALDVKKQMAKIASNEKKLVFIIK